MLHALSIKGECYTANLHSRSELVTSGKWKLSAAAFQVIVPRPPA